MPIFSIPPEIWRKWTVEDFESFDPEEIQWRRPSDPSLELPDYQISQSLVAPIPNSKQSFMLRFTPETNFPMEWKFPKAKQLDGFITKLEFSLYSSGGGGTLSGLLRLPDGSVQKFWITNLQFEGWKKIPVSFRGKVEQNDVILGKSLPSFFLGFVYEPDPTVSGKDLILGFDDITAEIRDKYRVLRDPETLLP